MTPDAGGPGAPAPAQAAAPSFGRADPVRHSTITGWFVAARQQSVIAAFIDGQAAGRATLSDSGIEAAPEGARGFAFPIPSRWQDGRPHVLVLALGDGTPIDFLSGSGATMQHLRFRFAASDQPVPDVSDEMAATAEAASTVEGVVDGLVGDTLSGWAIRRKRGSETIDGRLSIQVLCNGVTVGDVLADQPRPDVARDLRCDPHVGFRMRLPDECRNGHEFAFAFKVLPEGSELSGSPVAVRYRQVDAARELRALAATLDELCASAFRMQQQIRNLLPAPDATVADYDPWARRYQAQLRSRMAAAENLPDAVPLVSAIMPTSRPNLAHLTAAIESVRQQTYGNWELIIADDGSSSPALAACIRFYSGGSLTKGI